MREHPIIFSGPMVRAILDGRKTQTRRVVKPQPESSGRVYDDTFLADDRMKEPRAIRCPYGAPGGRLWVRETWCDLRGGGFEYDVAYRADSLNADGRENGDVRKAREDYGYKWRPSIHMPRWASRLTLEVTGVRVERLQEISEADAKSEGVKPYVPGHGPIDPRYEEPGMIASANYRDGFELLWDSLNAKRGHGWATNCWVWVVEFRRVS